MEVCYDAERMTLSCAQLSTTLGSNESDMLLALIAGITDKEAIISQVWGGRGLVVSDSSYYKTVHALRSKLVDVGVPRDSLKTLPKRGLILLCEITMVSAGAAVERVMPLHLEQVRLQHQQAPVSNPLAMTASKPAQVRLHLARRSSLKKGRPLLLPRFHCVTDGQEEIATCFCRLSPF